MRLVNVKFTINLGTSMKHLPIRKPSLVFAALAVLICANHSLKAETPNPFGNVQGGDAPVAPPPPQFSEDDDVAPDGSGPFGFNPPPPGANGPDANSGAFPPPAQPLPQAENTPPPQQEFSPPPPPSNPGRGGSRSNSRSARNTPRSNPPPVQAPTGTANNNGTGTPGLKPASQKLADYLELDPAVRGLEVKSFDLQDKEIKDVVTLISKWTNKNFILDNKVRGKITIIGPSQVTLQEAYQAFLSALEANSLTTIQSGKFIRIIESGEAKRMPVKTYSGDFAPTDDQFITRIVQLKYINADEVQREFRDLTTRSGKLFAYEPTNSLIITDTGSNIQRIREILDAIDVKSFETTLHVLRIKNGSAKAISDMLGDIYGEKGGTGQTRSFRRSALERTRGGGVISKIIPDESTNSLIVLANKSGFEQLLSLVGRLDIKVTDTGRIHVYYCEYAKAEDLASTLSSLSGGGSGGSGSRSRNSRNTTVTTPNAAPGTTGGTSLSGNPSSGPVTAELDGGVKVTSDSATNSLVIVANSSDYKTLRRVLRKLDIPRLQVFIETAILELNLDNFENQGVNLAAGSPNRAFAGGFIGDAASLTSFLLGGAPEGATVPIFAGGQFRPNITQGGTSTAVDVSTFMGLLNFVTKNTKSSLLSTPQIIALDNEKAEFKVQDEIPVQGNFTANLGAASGSGFGTGTIEKLKTGIEIKLTPQINAASRTVRLAIEQTVDSVKGNSDVPTALQAISKAKTTRVTNTSVIVRDLDYIMMSGLISDKVDETETKVPLLGDIPILGWLFKGKTYNAKKTNLVILLRPKIIDTTAIAASHIKEKLEERDDFIVKYLDKEQNEADVARIKSRIDEQEQRGKGQKLFDYRNNEEDDDDVRVKPGETSEIGKEPPQRTSSRNSNVDTGSQSAVVNPTAPGFSKLPPPPNTAPAGDSIGGEGESLLDGGQ